MLDGGKNRFYFILLAQKKKSSWSFFQTPQLCKSTWIDKHMKRNILTEKKSVNAHDAIHAAACAHSNFKDW